MKKIAKVFYLLLFLILIKELVWAFFIPAWHFPDEQEHFAHVSCNAELDINCREAAMYEDMSEEIVNSLNLLNVNRDNAGNNKFTYHPEFKIKYSNSLTGIYENNIVSMPVSSRKKMVKFDSAYYPELFYNISKIPYNLVYSGNIFERVFAVRIFWLPALLIIVWTGFKIGKILKPDSQIFPVVVATALGFQPMLSFVSSGVTSDNILNLLFSLVILELVFLLRFGFKLQFVVLLFIFTWLGINSKPQFYISFGLIAPVAIYFFVNLIREKNSQKFVILGILAAILSLVYLLFDKQIIKFIQSFRILFFAKEHVLNSDYSITDHFKWIANHTIREVIPWFWGVFRWLSLVLPRPINQILMRLTLIGFVGVFIKLIQTFFKKLNRQTLIFYFLIYSVLVYFLSLFFWDWNFIRTHNFSFGIQGRYYFPVIVPIIILLIYGVTALVELINARKFVKWIEFLLGFFFLALGTHALYWVIGSYYDISNFNSFIIQASQYKPLFAKGFYLESLLIIFIVSLIAFFYYFTSLALKNHEK